MEEFTFDELIEYSSEAIEESSESYKHDISSVSCVFQHDNGKFYNFWFFRSYNDGPQEEMGYGYHEVQKVEKVTEVWETV